MVIIYDCNYLPLVTAPFNFSLWPVKRVILYNACAMPWQRLSTMEQALF